MVLPLLSHRHLTATFHALESLLPGDVLLVVVMYFVEASRSAVICLDFKGAILRLEVSEEGLGAPIAPF